MKLFEGFKLDDKFVIKLGESMEYKTAFGRGVSLIVEGGFFEISIAASISAWAASTIADKLCANKLVHEREAQWEAPLWAASLEVTTCDFLISLFSNTAVIYLVLQALRERS